MVNVTHDDEQTESFDLTVRCPGVAFDIGQKGFPKTLVVQKLADSVSEYDGERGDGEKGQLEYLKNALVGATPNDAVYQCVYLTDNPVGRGELNDPKSRYPVPESRLIPFRADKADPVDNSPQWSPRESVQNETLESLFDIALTDDETPLDEDALEQAALRAGINSDVVRSAREASESFAADFHDDLSVDDGDGPDMELTETAADTVAKDEDAVDAMDPGDPPEVPSEDGSELDDFDSFDGDE